MKNKATSMVSCIMPTYNRREFIPNAIRYFLRQDYENKELIIIDDGEDAVKDLVPESDNIRYFRLEHKISLGAKLNLGCEYAKGDIIAHWDDDDWYASHRLSYQMEAIKNEQIAICGINNLLYYDLFHKKTYNYIYPANQRPWLSGSSLCYKKQFWKRHRFEEIDVGMDGLFVWKASRENIHNLADSTFAVHMIHGNNVSPKDTSNIWWHTYPVEEIKKIMDKDWLLYNKNRPTAKIGNVLEAKIKKPRTKIQPGVLKNIYACLVHEKPDCIFDMLRNLRYHDPDSIILLYNGSNNKDLLSNNSNFEKYGAVCCPNPKPHKWGYLHSFALQCMEFALDNFSFDTFTIVDSDQLSLRPGYPQFLSDYLKPLSDIGMLSIMPDRVTNDKLQAVPALEAYKEYELWKPFLQNFHQGESKFVHWTFWPSTVFTHDAVRDLVNIFKTNIQLKEILQHTKIWATEEVILPTIVKLLGYEIGLNPCSYDFVKFRKAFSIEEVKTALEMPAAFWIHPVERDYENPLRIYIRQYFNQYDMGCDEIFQRIQA